MNTYGRTIRARISVLALLFLLASLGFLSICSIGHGQKNPAPNRQPLAASPTPTPATACKRKSKASAIYIHGDQVPGSNPTQAICVVEYWICSEPYTKKSGPVANKEGACDSFNRSVTSRLLKEVCCECYNPDKYKPDIERRCKDLRKAAPQFDDLAWEMRQRNLTSNDLNQLTATLPLIDEARLDSCDNQQLQEEIDRLKNSLAEWVKNYTKLDPQKSYTNWFAADGVLQRFRLAKYFACTDLEVPFNER